MSQIYKKNKDYKITLLFWMSLWDWYDNNKLLVIFYIILWKGFMILIIKSNKISGNNTGSKDCETLKY